MYSNHYHILKFCYGGSLGNKVDDFLTLYLASAVVSTP